MSDRNTDIKIQDIDGSYVNPATEEKQNDIIAALGGFSDYAVEVAVSDNYTYVGEASPGTDISSALWRIKRVEEDGDDTHILWADGNSDFDNIWDNYASLSYS